MPTRIYNSPGTYTYIVGAGITNLVASLYGAGGGGGGVSSWGDQFRGASGGSGGKLELVSIPVTQGEELTIIVGKGGLQGIHQFNGNGLQYPNSGSNSGQAGGDTKIMRGAVELFKVTGGGGGLTYSSHSGSGGTAGVPNGVAGAWGYAMNDFGVVAGGYNGSEYGKGGNSNGNGNFHSGYEYFPTNGDNGYLTIDDNRSGNLLTGYSFSDLQNVFGGNKPISLSEYYSKTPSVPASGAIKISHFVGQSAMFDLTENINTAIANYSVKARAAELGWDGIKPIRANIVINNTGHLYATNTFNAGFSTGDLPDTSITVLTNYGFISGAGGPGGQGGDVTLGELYYILGSGSPGSPGGLAFRATSPVLFVNEGTVCAGGSGLQGSQGSVYNGETSIATSGNGGQGGRGYLGGPGGSPGNTLEFHLTGSAGPSGNINGPGDWASPNNSVQCIFGNSNITWIKTGTIIGTIT